MPNWAPCTIAQGLDRAAMRYADRPLVVTDERVWTFADIQNASRDLALRLIRHGVRPREHVALYLANHVEFVIARFAIARLGAVAVPINFLLRQHELAYVLEQSECVALIAMDEFRGRDYLADLDSMLPGWESKAGGDRLPKLRTVFILPAGARLRAGAQSLITALTPADHACGHQLAQFEASSDPHFRSDVIYTSGTTGRPKGVVLTHDMVMRTAYASAYTRAIEDGRRILFALPMYHVFGYVECLLACLFNGGAIVPRLVFDADDILTAAENHRVGEIVCVPLMTLKMIEVARARGFACPSLVAFFNSGGATPPSIWQEIRDVLGAKELLTGYGMTETTASTFCTLPEEDDSYLSTSNGRLKYAGVAGRDQRDGLLAIYRVIDPETGQELPNGAVGELMAKGYSVTAGYYKKPDENATAFTPDGWLHTGDLGTVSADGYVVLIGRIKESYRCGGEMVMPQEVEELLGQHPAVSNAYVVGVPDSKMGEVGCAFVVPRGAPPAAEDLIALCADRLARFKVPKHIIFVQMAEVPHTVTGRAQRVHLGAVARERLGL
ncbi:MAG: AMP-binding protein [Rhizobiales bacterium]|nr:AMP-binding protein [Hyphomicrobiales bacterium]